MFDLNPIDVLKQRKLKILPPHFSQFKLADVDFLIGEFEDWIGTKLKGRYCIVRSPNIDQDGRCKSSTFVAFEDQKELTYFMLACPYLRRN
jgi:hypothetical protein